MRLTIHLIAAFALPVPATAHPHIFVEAQVTVIFADDGAILVKLDWFYDDLFSLLVTSDLGIDMDGDLLLTTDEQALLDDQITAWPPDYTGDLEVSQDVVALTLADKQNHTMTYERGLFHEAHIRPIDAVADPAAPLEIRVYDPSFYTAYELRTPVIIAGRDDCAVQINSADIDAAYALAESQLDGRDPSTVGPDEYFPAIGDAFADTIVVTCADPL
ncbi:MAG: polyphosphate kinase [Yoonia sp.]|jgi:polyphosphate kinase